MSVIYVDINETEDSTGCSTLALSTINELLGRSYVPKQYELFFVNIFKQSFSLLQAITSSTSVGDQFDQV